MDFSRSLGPGTFGNLWTLFPKSAVTATVDSWNDLGGSERGTFLVWYFLISFLQPHVAVFFSRNLWIFSPTRVTEIYTPVN